MPVSTIWKTARRHVWAAPARSSNRRDNVSKKTRRNNIIITMIVTLLVIYVAIMITAVVIGDEAIQPYGMEMSDMMDEMIYVPAYPGDECTPKDRVLIDTPIRIVDADGNVAYHWMYECKNMAWNRSHTNPNCTSNT
jgi:hypothetical protein